MDETTPCLCKEYGEGPLTCPIHRPRPNVRGNQSTIRNSEDPCPVDAKNEESESPEQPTLLELALPVSLLEALWQLAESQKQTNHLLTIIAEQNHKLISTLLDEPEDIEPREDMEGRPIRDS